MSTKLAARLEVCDALGEAPYSPEIDPANFVAGIDNALLPYVPGTIWTYEAETEDGMIVNLEGSWEAGVDGASPGIVMPGTPMVGFVYRQEFLLGEAEDMGEVAGLDETVSVPYGDYTGALMIYDFAPVEPDVLEAKFYVTGVGLVLEVDEETGERAELVDVVTP